MDILFINPMHAGFDGVHAFSAPLGGTETAFLELSRALAARGHRVTVACAMTKPLTDAQGVRWIPLEQAFAADADAVIVSNDAFLLSHARPALAKGARSVVWFHNPVKRKHIIGRGNLAARLRWRPSTVFVGTVQAARCPRFAPLFDRHTIPHGISEFILTLPPRQTPPPPHAIYASALYRGLADMIRIWIEHIAPHVPEGEFHAYVGENAQTGFSLDILRAHRIVLKAQVPKLQLVEIMRDARLMIYPGHPEETFCLAAAECLCVGTPLVTRGLGSLIERVRDGVDGFIAPDDAGFAGRSIAILKDDALWQRLHQGALQLRNTSDWQSVAVRWESFLSAPTGR